MKFGLLSIFQNSRHKVSTEFDGEAFSVVCELARES